MEMEKKNLAIIILAVVLAVSGVGNVILAVMAGLVEVSKERQDTIIYGTMYGPVDADPQYMWDSASFDMALQVYEGLYAYNLTDPALPLIPKLAKDFGTWSGANYTIELREDVYFHSGTKFNATAVKFTFDRLNYLCNFSGDQPASGDGSTIYGESIIGVLYQWANGTPVIKEVEIIDEYTVKFVLNHPYGVFLSTLTFNAAMILDPNVAPRYDYICDGMEGATSETISGTGPYKFVSYTAGIETRFVRNDNYWFTTQFYNRGFPPPLNVKYLVFAEIQDSPARMNAMLAGDVNFLRAPHPTYHQQMRDDPDVVLYEGGPATITQYLGFNNNKWNFTWRSAFSFCINYSYAIKELMLGTVTRLKSPIPLGIKYGNWSFDVPDYNVTAAREYMVSMGLGSMAWTDDQWLSKANSDPFVIMNYTYNLGNQFREDFFTLFEENLKHIGIRLIENGLEWDPYTDLLYNVSGGHNYLDSWFIGWMPDYNDPSNYVNSLMSNVSSSNTAQVNDRDLEAYMLAGLQETDDAKRQQIYWDLQKYVVEELRPHAYVYVSNAYDAYSSFLKGYPSNVMDYVYFYPVYFT